MKRMLKLQIADSSYCLLSYKKHLEELKKTAREGKDPHCTKCDEFGFVIGSNPDTSSKKNLLPIICHCVSDEKSKLERKIEELETTIKKYNMAFSQLDNDMTLNIFAERFNQTDLINSIKKYLDLGSMNSLYIEGESGTGKTTMLKMLWQIYAINDIKPLYMRASIFEDMHKNLFNKNAQDRDLKSSIDAKIDNIKFADIIMIDDIDSVGF
ncbi:ATP-binding protein, partial [Brachyspira suanatina]